MNIDIKRVPRAYDKRIKLDESDREKIRKLREKDQTTWSYNALAIEFGVSKRLVIFICRPESLKKAKECYRERRKDKRYYSKDKHREYMRKHRAYKKELIEEGRIK